MTDRASRLRELRQYADQGRTIQGWTFAYEPQPLGPPPPWNYEQRARQLAAQARRVLDMGTGGGEILAQLLEGLTCKATATEEWSPNVPVAARRLAPLGVPVVQADSLRLPCASSSLDLVLNRHEALAPKETARVLAPGGRILTQQIHPDWHAELRDVLPRMTRFEPHHELYPQGFEEAGLIVETRQSHERPMAYRHLGEIVYMLAAAPWTVPDFEVEADLEALLEAERKWRRPEGIVLTDRRYIIEARKP